MPAIIDTLPPAGWDEKPLNEFATFEKGHVVATQPHSGAGFLPYIGAESFGGNFSQFTGDKSATTCEPLDVLMLWDGERSGLCAGGLSGAIGSTVVRLRPREGVDGRFLYFQLTRHFTWIQARRTGTGVPHVPKDLATLLRLHVPKDKDEQTRIAVVLDTVDEAIAKTVAVIAKLRQVSGGLIHDLLTRGLDANGQIRDPIAHPEQFQDSPLGRIPREWELASLISRITLPQGQVDPRFEPYCDWTLVAPDHIESETGRLLGHQTARQQDAISGKYVFEPGDVLYSKIRPYLRKAVLATERGLCSADMYPLCPNAGVNSRFLLAVVLGESFSRFASAVSMRSGFPKLNRDELAEFTMGWPKTDEQNRIALLLMAADDDQLAIEKELSKLYQLKSGLMNDLLTGRVRVPETIGATP
jgi:type I restriction enzyme S subunit